ncbi:hypothetical protein ABIC03_007878 [Bradyrhizobium sp. RT6a]
MRTQPASKKRESRVNARCGSLFTSANSVVGWCDAPDSHAGHLEEMTGIEHFELRTHIEVSHARCDAAQRPRHIRQDVLVLSGAIHHVQSRSSVRTTSALGSSGNGEAAARDRPPRIFALRLIFRFTPAALSSTASRYSAGFLEPPDLLRVPRPPVPPVSLKPELAIWSGLTSTCGFRSIEFTAPVTAQVMNNPEIILIPFAASFTAWKRHQVGHSQR